MNMYLQKIAQVPNQNTTVTCNEQFYSFITVKQYSFRLGVSSYFEKKFSEHKLSCLSIVAQINDL